MHTSLPLLFALLSMSGAQEIVGKAGPDAGFSKGFGKSVLELEDLNGDGKREFAVGIPLDNVVVVLSGEDRSVMQTWSTEQQPVWMGSDLSLVGDVNGDGSDDVLVGFNPYLYKTELPYGAAL